MAKKKPASQPTPVPAGLSQQPVIPAKLLQGQTVCVAGRFTYHPAKKDLVKFLEREGAVLAEKVTEKVDKLIVGGGAKSAAEKQAEKLNASGSCIEIIKDLNSLFAIDITQHTQIIKDVHQLKRFSELPKFAYSDRFFEFSNKDFQAVEVDSNHALTIDNIAFYNCSFDSAKLKGIYLFNRGSYTHCSFNFTVLESFGLSNVSHCSFGKTIGKKVTAVNIANCTFDHVDFDDLTVDSLNDCKFQDSKLRQLTLHGYHIDISGTTFNNSVVQDSKSERSKNLLIEKSIFHNMIFRNVDFSDMAFADCQLENTIFEDCIFGRLLFERSTVFNCKFIRGHVGLLDLSDSKLDNIETKELNVSTVQATDEQLQNISGLQAERALLDSTNLQLLSQLADAVVNSDSAEFELSGKTSTNEIVVLNFQNRWYSQFSYKVSGDSKREGAFDLYRKYGSRPSTAETSKGFYRLIRESGIDEIDLASLKSKTSKCPMKTNDFRQCIVNAVYEGIGKEPQSKEELVAVQKQIKDEASELRKSMLQQLQSGDVAGFNKRSSEDRKKVRTLKKCQAPKLALPKLNASNLDLSESNFAAADLSSSNFANTTLRKVSFAKANLTNSDFKRANLRGADLTQADMSGSNLQHAELRETNFSGTNLADVNLSKTSICGVDFSKAKLNKTNLTHATYDEKTLFPMSFNLLEMKDLRWAGSGVPPHERQQNKKTSGPINFEQFMARLVEITDSSRLQKSMQMLKKDSFQLFSQVSEDAMAGIVKSQSDRDLVYSCSLDAAGGFACCTQNLNPCGGLRGSLCKHILVLVVGLTKSGELDPTKVDQWVNSSKLKQPNLDKDLMSEILLKYKGAEAGEIDWRPTETVPEDYFAF